MLPHARIQLQELAARCSVEELGSSNGWDVDLWRMDDGDVGYAIEVYEALLLGGTHESAVTQLLLAYNIPLSELLLDSDETSDEITRSDVAELTAAASMLALDDCHVDFLHMPNVPKMSRRKSDSGLDIANLELLEGTPDAELNPPEFLKIASVKHTIQDDMGDVRRRLVQSLSEGELSGPKLGAQLRVLHGRLLQEGVASDRANRVYLFIRDFPDPDFVALRAVAVVDPSHEPEVGRHLALLPDPEGRPASLRIVLFPGLASVHDRCP